MKSAAHPHSAAYRIIDANSNRAMEGLRTLEEYARFRLELPELNEQLKQVRHELGATLASLDRAQLLASRDTAGDVGTKFEVAGESRRDSLEAVVTAAAQRVQQALRCLEEYGKVLSPPFARRVEGLRYRVYDLCAAVERLSLQQASQPWPARLYLLIDCQLPIDTWVSRVREVAIAGVDVIQLRDKQRATAELLLYGRRLLESLDRSQTSLIINDRVDIAGSLGVGVHLGQSDLPLNEARRWLGDRAMVGVSTHSLEQAQEAQQRVASYIGCGPTFPSATKAFTDFPGLSFLAEVAARIEIPAFAIGGITLERLDEVLATGMRRVAVSHAIWHARDPAAAAAEFARRLKEASAISRSSSGQAG
jgi:thiamine-phosphate pyrophosphorylase